MNERLMQLLKDNLSPFHKSDGRGYPSVSFSDLKDLIGDSVKDIKAAMIACLEKGVWPACFISNRGALTVSEQIKLLQSKVAIIGAGGLGGTVIHGLARIGVGSLNICDGDTFEESNLNRQVLARLDRIGMNKARCAADEIKAINPAIEVNVYDQWADETNLSDILEECQVAVDCLDNMNARYQLQDASESKGIPFVHGSVGGMEGFVMIIQPGDRGLTKVYGRGNCKDSGDDPEIGFPFFTPLMVASLQVRQVVNILTGRQVSGEEKVLHIDMSVPAIVALDLPEA